MLLIFFDKSLVSTYSIDIPNLLIPFVTKRRVYEIKSDNEVLYVEASPLSPSIEKLEKVRIVENGKVFKKYTMLYKDQKIPIYTLLTLLKK